MTPEKHDKPLTRWLLMATIALLALVLGLQLWQMFGRPAPGNSTNAPPLTQDASNPEHPQAAGTPQQVPGASPEPQMPSAGEPPSTQADGTAQAPASSAQTPPSGAQAAPASGEEAAKNAAFTHAGVSAADAEAVRCKLDRDDSRQVYDIEFWVGNTEYDYEIDASTNTVLEAKQEQNRHHDSTAPQQSGSFVGEEAAKSAALAHAGVSAADAGYVKCELDEDDGRWIYELEFRVGSVEYDYEVDASSGAVVKAEQDH